MTDASKTDHPPQTAVRALHHLALGTADVAGLAAFYADVVGLPVLQRHLYESGGLRSVWLDAGGVVLMIEPTLHQRSRASDVDDGLFLLAFGCASDARNTLATQWEQAGARYQAESRFSVYFRDPDGNRFALTSYPDESSPYRATNA